MNAIARHIFTHAALIATLAFSACAIGNEDALDHLTVNDPLFVAAGTNRSIYVSEDGVSWREVSNLGTGLYSASAYGKKGFIFAGTDAGGDGYAAQSSDGESWNTVVSGAGTPQLRGAAYNNGVYHITTFSSILLSYNGTQWIDVLTAGNILLNLTEGDDIYISSGYSYVYKSSDGNNWSLVTSASGYNFYDVIYAQGLFVFVGEGGGWGTINTSVDGANISGRLIPNLTHPTIRAITYGNKRFVAVGQGSRTWFSDDGYNWNYNDVAAVSLITDITFANGLFAATCSGPGKIILSEDGENWTLAQDPPGSFQNLFTITRRP